MDEAHASFLLEPIFRFSMESRLQSYHLYRSPINRLVSSKGRRGNTPRIWSHWPEFYTKLESLAPGDSDTMRSIFQMPFVTLSSFLAE